MHYIKNPNALALENGGQNQPIHRGFERFGELPGADTHGLNDPELKEQLGIKYQQEFK